MDNDFATGYALGSDSNSGGNNGGGMFGGGWDAWIVIILFALIFGWGNGGWGNQGNSGQGSVIPVMSGMATRADITEGFAFNDLQRGVSAVQQGICDSTYSLTNAINSGFNSTNTAMMQGFNGVDKSLCQLGYNLQQCCCDTQQAIQGVRYDMATQACDTRRTVTDAARDIIDSQNAGTRAIMDYMSQRDMADLRAENQALKFAASQQAQNAYIAANQEAQTAELIRRLGRDCPVPAYVVPNPNCCYGNPVGVGYNGGCGGCGQYAA